MRVRLTGSDIPGSGRLEVWSGGYWAGVATCALPYWGANRTCQELGYQSGQSYPGGIFAPVTSSRYFYASCSNSSLASIADCTWAGSPQYCGNEDANLACNNNTGGLSYLLWSIVHDV